ncbi:MAG: hypothetical protein V3V28_05030 [Polaribacter sp.]|uniref:hypothetical protein n=1 Tax=Polaribacter sp. TaxID=1920175 RepID=UPI002F356BC1
MKHFFLLFFLLFLTPNDSFSQKLEEPNYPNCSGLREKNENYASADGNYITWCQMKKQTAYVRCQCKREKMRAEYKKEREEINEKRDRVSDQAKGFYDQFTASQNKAKDYEGKLYEDDNPNFESDRKNAISAFNTAREYRKQNLINLEKGYKLCLRVASNDFHCKSSLDYIKYAKNDIENIGEKIEELKNKQRQKKLSITFNNTTSSNSNSSNKLNYSSNKNTNNNNTNNNKKNSNSNTYRPRYQNNTNKSYNNSRTETYQQKQVRLKREKKNKEIEENNRRYKAQLARIESNKRFHAKMEAYSRNAMSKFDQAAQGDLMAAGIMKGTYAIAMASQGYTDKTAIIGAATNIIGGLMQNAERKRKEEARLAAIATAKRKREAAKRKFIAKLVRNRKVALARMPAYKYPSFLTEESANSVFFFAMLADEEKLKKDLPEIKITDLIEVARYSDGTWPSENVFKQKLTKYGSYDVKIIGAFTNYSIASRKLEQLIKGFAENGVKIKLINAAKDFIVEKRENSTTKNSSGKNDFWGTSISEKGKEIKKPVTKKETSKTKKEVSIANENGLWGKSITLEKKKEPILAVKKKVSKKKKKDLWGKTIKVEKKKDTTAKKKKIKKLKKDFKKLN